MVRRTNDSSKNKKKTSVPNRGASRVAATGTKSSRAATGTKSSRAATGTKSSRAATGTKSSRPPPKAGSRLRIPEPPDLAQSIGLLVVDRDPRIVSACRVTLENNGFVVEGADSIAAAIKALERGRYDVALVELALPDGTGLDLLGELRRISPSTIPIVTSEYSTVRNAVEAVRRGAYDYLVKPFSDDVLVESVSDALEKRAFFGTSLTTPATEFREMLGNSRAMLELRQWIRATAGSHASVLLLGELGTGKELVGRLLHRRSFRSDGPFVTARCSGAESAQILDEWFGSMRGDAVVAGAFTKAAGGTLFLRDVGDLAPDLQAALQTALSTRRYVPQGSSEQHKLNVRLISATDRNLSALVADRRFRRDLFHAISSHAVTCPPLRERREDIPLLVDYFLTRFCRQAHHPRMFMTPGALTVLSEHTWPGNVRELECVIEEAALRVSGNVIDVNDLRLLENRPVVSSVPTSAAELKRELKALRAEAVIELERLFVVRALERYDGNVSAAARAVGMQRPNFQALMRRHRVRSGRDMQATGEDESQAVNLDAEMED